MNSSHKYFLDVFDPPALSRRVFVFFFGSSPLLRRGAFVFSVAAPCFIAELSFFRWEPPALAGGGALQRSEKAAAIYSCALALGILSGVRAATENFRSRHVPHNIGSVGSAIDEMTSFRGGGKY